MESGFVIRVEEAGLGPAAQVRLVLSGTDNLASLHRPWASSGATIERLDGRMRATTTVEALARAAGRTLEPEAAGELDEVLRAAVAAWLGPTPNVELADGSTLRGGTRPLVMGVVNVTSDSFSDGGLLYPEGHPEAAVAHGRRLVEEGADILDVGGESTRPGSEPIEPDEELRRVVPVVEALAGSDAAVSIDTTKAAVAEAALAAGATIVNDVSGARHEDLLDVTARRGAAYVLMHMRGTPKDMQQQTDYGDVVAEVFEFLAAGLQRCEAAGIARERILVDPGIGFAKTAEHNLQLLQALRQLRSLGRPVLVGASRKGFLGRVLGSDEEAQRVAGSVACATLATQAGAGVLRVHDVADTLHAVRIAEAVMTGSLPQTQKV